MSGEVENFHYPWYFDFNDVVSSWRISEGEHSTVVVADTCIDIHHLALTGKISYKNDQECFSQIEETSIEMATLDTSIKSGKLEKNDIEHLELKLAKILPDYFHGTAMAGLILASKCTLEKDPYSNLPSEFGNKLSTVGIAPKATIRGIEGFSIEKLETGFTEIKKEASDKKLLFKEIRRLDTFLINISGGQKNKLDESFYDDYANKVTAWNDFIKRVCNNDNMLIIAAVGNNGMHLTKETAQRGFLPAALKIPKYCKDQDVILRVGATNYYKDVSKINMYAHSNYGHGYVEILAPGAAIPVITPKNFSTILGGTSEATAIVTGAAALLASCRQDASAIKIKKALLDHSDRYKELESFVQNGNVLNIGKAVKNFCEAEPIIPTILFYIIQIIGQ